MRELLAILDQMNRRIHRESIDDYDGGDTPYREYHECDKMISELRELTSHMPDFAAAFRPQEVSK